MMRERLEQLAFQKFHRMEPILAEIPSLCAKDGLHFSLLKSVSAGERVAWVPSWNPRVSVSPALKVWQGCHAGPWSWENFHRPAFFGVS